MFNFDKFPILETPRLRLRQMVTADAEDIFRIFADDEVTFYYDFETFTSVEEAHSLIDRQNERFNRKEGLRWGITFKEQNIVIGTCGLMITAYNRQGGIGYDLAKPYWRQGIMFEVLEAVIKFGFETADLNRFQALVIPGNEPSAKLLFKLGFQEEGTLREYGYFKGQFHDLRCFSLLHKDIGR